MDAPREINDIETLPPFSLVASLKGKNLFHLGVNSFF